MIAPNNVRHPRNVDLAIEYWYVCFSIVEERAIHLMMWRIMLTSMDITAHFRQHRSLKNADLPGIGRETQDILEDVMRFDVSEAHEHLVERIECGEATEHLLTVPPSHRRGTRPWHFLEL